MRSAKMGISTVYGMPVTLTMPSRIKIAWTGGLRMTNRNPSTTREMGDAGWFTASRRFTSISSRPAITARKLTPLTKKHHPSPMPATSRPAMAGPTTRDALNMEELSAMAFIRSRLPTISTMKDWRAGISKEFAVPSRAERTKMCQMRTDPESVSAASTKASNMEAVCVAMTMWRRLYRSATMPPTADKRKTGICPANPTARTIGIKQMETYPLPSYLNAVAVPSGYVNDGFFAYIFRNGIELRTTGRMPVASPVTDASVQITGNDPWATATQLATIQPGDTLVLELRAGIGTIFATNTISFTLQDISVYASGFIGVFTNYGSSVTVDHVQVIPRPGTDRMISTNADGIHLAPAGGNTVVTNNTVKRGCDDAIAIDGQWAAIVSAASSGTTVQVTRHNNVPIAVGEAFDFIDITTAAIVGIATVTAESPLVSAQTGSNGETIRLTLDHAVSVKQNFGVAINDPNLSGSGTLISGNLVYQQTFGRGIYPAGVANVTVSNNMLEATDGGGILVEQDRS